MGESKSTVYLAVAGEGKNKSLIDGTRALYKAMKMPVKKNSLVAVKLHFGEMGTTSFLRPIFVGAVVEEIKSAGGKPFLTDTNTLYTGTRSNAVEHIQTAMRHGFVPPTVDAPIIIGDGLKGKDIDIVPFEGGKHLKRALLGTAIFQADNMVALSHFKGHEMTGFGGAIKNIGMGIGSRAGKEMMHGD
ncbi:MAG: DUF362 domain-containing protein, partial [Candidatus Thermoplasmatota archaeon]|nr:DUF362 domain-containing protein [Candidatus Thermoplasmatota archaeon]